MVVEAFESLPRYAWLRSVSQGEARLRLAGLYMGYMEFGMVVGVFDSLPGHGRGRTSYGKAGQGLQRREWLQGCSIHFPDTTRQDTAGYDTARQGEAAHGKALHGLEGPEWL